MHIHRSSVNESVISMQATVRFLCYDRKYIMYIMGERCTFIGQ